MPAFCFGIEQSEAHLQAKQYDQLSQFVSLLKIAPWDEVAASHYGNIRAALQRQGLPIGNMDMLIAAHARSLNETLVSNNLRENLNGWRGYSWRTGFERIGFERTGFERTPLIQLVFHQLAEQLAVVHRRA